MVRHFKSLENQQEIIEYVFGCGNMSVPDNDLCEICEMVYSAYIMQQMNRGAKMGDDETKPEDAEKKEDKPEEEPKEEKKEETPAEDKPAE